MHKLKNLVVIALMAMVALPVLGQKTTPQQRFDLQYEQAMDLYRKAKYVSAQHQLDQLAKREEATPRQKADAVYYAAVCSEALGSNDAMYRLEEFLRCYPESSRANMAHFYMGNTHYAKGEYSLALQQYKQVNPSEIEYGHRDEYDYKCGYCNLNIGDRATAKSHFAHIMNGKSKYKTNALYYYAHIQYVDHEYAQALKNFQKIKEDKKTKAGLVKIVDNYIVRIYYYLGREDEFLQMAPRLMNDDGVFKKEDIQQMMGEVYFNRGEYAQALHYYRMADQEASKAQTSTTKGAANQPTTCVVGDNTYQIGYCYYMLGQYDSAASCLVKKTACNDSVAQNALYTLGDTYVKLGRKSEARSMFLQASRLDYNAKIKEDALFNYAKLSCELNQNAYNESIKSFESYLERYPKTKHKAEIQEILTSLYFTTRNYKDALALIEKIEPKNAQMNQAYQRLLINRGIELFNARNTQEASSYFLKAIKVNAAPKYTADAYYLYAESKYRLADNKGARSAMNKFFQNTKHKESPYYGQALYTYGYIRMADEAYGDAANYLTTFIKTQCGKVDRQQCCDAYNRLGDCQYAQKRFDDAITDYNYVIDHGGKDADYATYQKALCYGAIGKNEEKLTYLNHIFERYKGSQYSSKAMFEVANTYLVCDNNEMALLYFDKFIKTYPNSSYVKEALLGEGLIYYNTNRNKNALECFEKLLTDYQGTEEARDALVTVKNIYIAENRIDDYFTYVKENTHIVISNSEQDSTTFSVAANRYYEGDYQNAIPGLENYLRKYPHGLSSLAAHYYLADALFRSGQNEAALPHFEAVAQRNKNQYTEQSLYNAANISYSLNDYTKALDYYVQLVALSENDNSRLQSRLGIMRCWTRLGDHQNTIRAAKNLLAEPKITVELSDEAYAAMAQSYYRNNNLDSANVIYALLAQSSNSDYSGEAVYRQTEILYKKKDYVAAEKAIEAIVANPPSDYWLAKTFILWADIFYAQGNALQAKQTLQSIIDNYDGDDLVTEALQKRNAILEAEAAANNTEEKVEEIQVELPLDE